MRYALLLLLAGCLPTEPQDLKVYVENATVADLVVRVGQQQAWVDPTATVTFHVERGCHDVVGTTVVGVVGEQRICLTDRSALVIFEGR